MDPCAGKDSRLVSDLNLPLLIGATTFLLVLVIFGISSEIKGIRTLRKAKALIGGGTEASIEELAGQASGLSRVSEAIIKFLPSWLKSRSETQLLRAGFYGLAPRSRLLLVEATLVFAYVLVLALQFSNNVSFLIVLVFGGLLVASPRMFLISRAKSRAKQMATELPNIVDLMLLVVSGGLGLTAALNKVVKKQNGLLVGELVRTLDDILLGIDRVTAFAGLAQRSGSQEVKRFADAIMKVDQLGVSLITVLRAQANEMRHRNRIVAREQAQKITVKILFPLILCFLPGLFIVVIGPAVINILGSLGL